MSLALRRLRLVDWQLLALLKVNLIWYSESFIVVTGYYTDNIYIAKVKIKQHTYTLSSGVYFKL